METRYTHPQRNLRLPIRQGLIEQARQIAGCIQSGEANFQGMGFRDIAVGSFYILAYDITDNRRRAKIAKIIESAGKRVQGSVFEVYLTPANLDALLQRVGKVIKKDQDSLRGYFMCESCREKIRTIGTGQAPPPPRVQIIRISHTPLLK